MKSISRKFCEMIFYENFVKSILRTKLIIFSFLTVQCLLDFNELSPAVPVATFFQEMNDRKNLSSEFLELSLPNLACYLSCIPFEQVFFSVKSISQNFCENDFTKFS